jgi:hypothetical protein
MDQDYTLADLTRLSGARRRSLQLWAEGGVLLADGATERAGTGTHRKFSRKEAVIACILHSLALDQMPIGALLRASRALREFASNPTDWSMIENAINNEMKVFLIMVRSEDAPWSFTIFEPSADEDMEEHELATMGRIAVERLIEHRHSLTRIIYLNDYLRNLR